MVLDGPKLMAKVLNDEAKKHNLSVRAVTHTTGGWYEIRDGKKPIYRSPRSEDIDAYLGRLTIANRFK